MAMGTRRFLALAAIALSVVACSSGAAADPTADEGAGGELQATTWVLQSFDSAGTLAVIPPDQYADAEFRAQRVRGFAGCNDFDAVYRSGGRMLDVGMTIVTTMSCGEAGDAFQTRYLTLLQASRSYNIRNDTLTIRGPDAHILLVFEAAPSNPLLGSWIVDSIATTPGTVAVPLPGTELTVVFRLRTVSGSSGCNSFQGQYTTNGTAVAIGPLASTQMACAEDVMTQEQQFLKDLQGVGRVERRLDRLTLSDVGGSLLLGLVKPSTPEASPSPGAVPVPSLSSAPATATPKPSPTPTATPTVAPTPSPTPVPTATPTVVPSAGPSGTPAPTVAPPASIPPTASCQLVSATNVAFTIIYPATWFTLSQPTTLACRYFDPAQITVPADPATLHTAVMVKGDDAISYQDALAAATNPASWDVLTNQPVTIGGLPATRLQATSKVASPGYPVGVTRYGYLIDAGGHAAWIETSGTVGSPTFATDVSVVDLIVSQSKITPPPAS